MSSTSSINREKLSLEILVSGIEMAPCTNCRNAKSKRDGTRSKCIVGPRSGKCSECVRKGVRCDVTVSRAEWERIRDGRDKLRRELERAEEREVELMGQLFEHRARTLRLRKQLRQAENRTDKAVAEELEGIEEAERVEAEFLPAASAEVEVEDRPFFHDILEMPPEDWLAIDGDMPFPFEIPNSQPEAAF